MQLGDLGGSVRASSQWGWGKAKKHFHFLPPYWLEMPYILTFSMQECLLVSSEIIVSIKFGIQSNGKNVH